MKNGLEQHVRFFLAEKPLKSQEPGLFAYPASSHHWWSRLISNPEL